MTRTFLLALAAIASAPVVAATPAEPAEVPVLSRAIEKGELLSEADFETGSLTGPVAQGAMSPEDAAGMEAARRLRAGAAVRRADVMPARMVRRGEPVTILVRSGPLAISAQGKALSSGGHGDLVRVVNAATARTLDAVVEGPGRVQILIQ